MPKNNKSKIAKYIAENSQNIKIILVYLLITFLLVPVLYSSGNPFRYDWTWPVFSMDEYLKILTLKSHSGVMEIFLKYPWALLGAIRLSPNLVLKLFLLTIHTCAGYGFYLFMRSRIKNQVLAFIGGIAYAFSPYIFIRTVVGFSGSMIGYAVSPVFLYWYFKSEKQSSVWHYLLLGILLSFIFSQIQLGLLMSLVMTIYLIFTLIIREDVKLELKKYFLTFVFLLGVNLPWLINTYRFLGAGSIVSGKAVSTLGFVASLPHSYRNIITLSDHHITADFFRTLSHNYFYLLGFLFIWVIAFISIFSKKNLKLALSFIISMIIIFPFLKGPTGVFGHFYIWFYNHFPQIMIFRETYHFGYLYAVGLIVLFFIGLDLVWNKMDELEFLKRSNRRLILKILTGGSFLLIIAPYLTFNYAGYLNLKKVPASYYQLNAYFKTNKNVCSRIYYPPGIGFIYFKGDKAPGASNSDIFASAWGILYLDDGTSVLNLPSDGMFYRNEVASQFLEKGDHGEFVNLLNENNVDCVVVRQDIDTKFDQASNLSKEKDKKILDKWLNQDMLALAKSKKGLKEIKSFGNDVYVFKPETTVKTTRQVENIQDVPKSLARDGVELPITDWTLDASYYENGWSRGRYDFWRKHLFTQLRQDFIYTNKKDSSIGGKVSQRGLYELWARYLTGGTAGKYEIMVSNTKFEVLKDQGNERFVMKKLGDVQIKDGNVSIKNIYGENAVANLILIKK